MFHRKSCINIARRSVKELELQRSELREHQETGEVQLLVINTYEDCINPIGILRFE